METSIPTISFGKTDPGLRRSHNEDSVLLHNAGGYFLVADGVGGAAAGEVASALFAQAVAETFSVTHNRSLEETLISVKESFLKANSRILAHIAATPAHSGMGCTAELLALHDRGFVLGHIGDSRTYRLRQAAFTRLTTDHSLVQQQLDQGLIDWEQARKHPMKNVILRAVGVESELAVDIIQGQVLSGDVFLLCTDGLSDMIDDSQMQEILMTTEPLAEKVDMLVSLANSTGGRDNISVVLVEVQ